MAAHAVHFAVVARYAVVNGGRDLFPGGRSLHDVGGWPTVAGIYTFFSGLAVTGWAAGAPRAAGQPSLRAVGQAATGLMAAMFVERLSRAAPTVAVVRAARHRRGGGRDRQRPGSSESGVFRRSTRQVAWDGARHQRSPRLGDVLVSRRRQRFVGRAAEIELFRACLDAESPAFAVLFVHGPGGIGKSSLLDAFAVAARRKQSATRPARCAGSPALSRRRAPGYRPQHCMTRSATAVTGRGGRSCCWTPTNGSRRWTTGSASSCCRISPPTW